MTEQPHKKTAVFAPKDRIKCHIYFDENGYPDVEFDAPVDKIEETINTIYDMVVSLRGIEETHDPDDLDEGEEPMGFDDFEADDVQ